VKPERHGSPGVANDIDFGTPWPTALSGSTDVSRDHPELVNEMHALLKEVVRSQIFSFSIRVRTGRIPR
jgi:hypothetical protein